MGQMMQETDSRIQENLRISFSLEVFVHTVYFLKKSDPEPSKVGNFSKVPIAQGFLFLFLLLSLLSPVLSILSVRVEEGVLELKKRLDINPRNANTSIKSGQINWNFWSCGIL